MVAPSPVVQHQEGRAATADGAQGSGPPWQRGQRGRGAARNLSSSSDASPRPSSASLRAHLQLTPEIKSTDAGVPKARVTSAGQPADVAAKKAGRSEGEGPPRSSLINYLSSDYVCVSDLHWFTTEDDLLDAAKQAGVKLGYKDLAFTEHKVNGKSKGIVTIDCRSPELASKLVHWFHHNDFQGKKIRPTYVTGLEQGRGSQHPSRPGSSHGYAAPFATNAHGGINFNRLRPNKAVYGMPNGGNDTYIANRQARYETTDEIQYPSIRQHAPPRAHVPLKGQGGIKQYVDLAGQGAFGSEYAHAYGVAATPTPANAGGLGTGYQGYGQKSGLFHKIAIGKLQVQDPVQLVPRHHWNISQAVHGMYGQQPYVSDRDHPEYGHIGRGRPAGQALTLNYAA